MRKFTVLLILLLLTLPLLMGMGFEREYTLEADGIVDVYTVTKNQVAGNAMKITGEGVVFVDAKTNVKELSLKQDYDIIVKSKDKTLTPLEVVVSSMDLLREQVYAGMIAPAAGETATMKYNIDILGGELAEVKVAYEAAVNYGQYKHYINMFNEDVSLYEYYDINGRAYFRDSLLFVYHDRSEAAEVETIE
jgi:hypothetical protein